MPRATFELTFKSTVFHVRYEDKNYILSQEWDEQDGGGSGDIHIVDIEGLPITEEVRNAILQEYYQ